MKPARESVIVEFVCLDDPHPFPRRTFGQRLKAVLKTALRGHGLKCKRMTDGEKTEITLKPMAPLAEQSQ